MQFAISIIAMAGAAIAHPAIHARAAVCSGLLYSVPQCCNVDVLGVADLDCNDRTYFTEGVFGDFDAFCSHWRYSCIYRRRAQLQGGLLRILGHVLHDSRRGSGRVVR